MRMCRWGAGAPGDTETPDVGDERRKSSVGAYRYAHMHTSTHTDTDAHTCTNTRRYTQLGGSSAAAAAAGGEPEASRSAGPLTYTPKDKAHKRTTAQTHAERSEHTYVGVWACGLGRAEIVCDGSLGVTLWAPP